MELTKPRITLLVLVTTVVGFYMGSSGGVNLLLLFHAIFGTALVASGASAMNEYVERDLDARMARTRNRTLPDGRLLPGQAWIFTDDYTRAGFSMHVSGEKTGRQIIFFCCALIPVSILPTFFGLTGMTYFVGAVLLGFLYLGYGFAVALFRSNTHAHRLLRVSVLYLPALLVLMMVDKV